MATRLKDTDVVIIGLGAAGGVAALPLAQAGLEVIGLEAGTWLTRRDFAPDELRNNYRGWPQAVQKANQEIPTSRATASSPTGPRGAHPSDAERRRRHDAALLGAELAAEPVGLQGRQRDEAPLRRVAHPDRARRSRTGRSASTSSSRTTTRSSTRSACRARPATSTARSIRAATRSKARASAPTRCRRCAARSSSTRWRGAREVARLASVSRARRRSTRARTRIDPACMYHGFCNRGGCHVDAKNSTAVTTIPRAQATGQLKVVTRAHVTTIEVDGDGRATGVNYVTDGVEYFQPAKVVLLASFTYENTRLLLLSKSKAFPNGLSNNHGRSAATTSATIRARRCRRCFRSTSTAGTACRRRASPSTTGPTTTSITRASISSAAATCG